MRARGANAQMCIAFETTPGTAPASGFFKVPFVSATLGEEQKLVASDLLGQGRDPADPSRDVIDNTGQVVVPVDLRNSGLWLKALLGAPTTTAGIAATGSFAFSAQPADSATLTVGTSAWTFVSASPAGDESLIGSSLKETLQNAVVGLNESATADFADCKFELALDGKTINVTYSTPGVGGNSVALAADASSNATASGADLAGGAATGAYNHVFSSGLASLPSLANEIGLNDVSRYGMNTYVGIDSLEIQLQRSGLLNATLTLIAQAELRAGASAAGVPTELAVTRFTQFTGKIRRSGINLGSVVSGNFKIMNNLDKVEVIREDGRIDGWDAGEAAYSGQAVVRFEDETLMDLASAGTPIDLVYGWKISATQVLEYTFHRVFLPKPQVPISGPGGVEATYDWQAAKDATAGCAVTVRLVNDRSVY